MEHPVHVSDLLMGALDQFVLVRGCLRARVALGIVRHVRCVSFVVRSTKPRLPPGILSFWGPYSSKVGLMGVSIPDGVERLT